MNKAKRITALALGFFMILPMIAAIFPVPAEAALDDASKVELVEIQYTFYDFNDSTAFKATNKKGNTTREVTYNGYMTDADGYLDKSPLQSWAKFKTPPVGRPNDMRYQDFDATIVFVDKNIKLADEAALKDAKVRIANCKITDCEFSSKDNDGKPSDKIVVKRSNDGYLQFEVPFTRLIYADGYDTSILALDFAYYESTSGAEVKHPYELKFQMIGADKSKTGNGDGGDDPDDDDNNSDGNTGIKIKSSTPYIIISNYTIEADDLVAGSSFPITIEIRNTHSRIHIENILMTITTGDGLQITNSSNTFYIEKLASGAPITRTIDFTVLPAADVKSHPINIEFSYEYISNDQRNTGQTREAISVPVVQRDRFSAFTATLSPELYPNEAGELTVSYVNKGRSQVYNLTSEVICEGISNGNQQQNLGNIAAGAGGDVSFDLTPTVGGTITGTVEFTYEDASTNILKYSVPFTTTAMNMEGDAGMNPGMEFPEEVFPEEPVNEEGAVPGWVWGAVALTGIAAFGGGAYVYTKKKQAKELVEDDEDI